MTSLVQTTEAIIHNEAKDDDDDICRNVVMVQDDVALGEEQFKVHIVNHSAKLKLSPRSSLEGSTSFISESEPEPLPDLDDPKGGVILIKDENGGPRKDKEDRPGKTKGGKEKEEEEEEEEGIALDDDFLITDGDDDDDEDDFEVHFVHHGRRTDHSSSSLHRTPSAEMAGEARLLAQITELQEAVVAMKGSLQEAVTRLGSVVEDPSISSQLQASRQQCDSNTAEVLKLVLSLKTDISSLKKEISTVSSRQEALQTSVCHLLDARRVLVAELAHSGLLTEDARTRLDCCTSEYLGLGHSGTGVTGGGGRGGHPGQGDGGGGMVGVAGSGSHSNDSGVAMLLERAHQAFNDVATPSGTHSGALPTSDQDSLPEQPSLLVPASVYDYVAGLGNHAHPPVTPTPQPLQHSSLGTPGGGSGGNEDLGLVYDSDSSLTIAANKSISLSASLSQQCGLELHHAHSGPSPSSAAGHHDPTSHLSHNRSDSDASDNSRELAQTRRSRSQDYGDETPLHHHHRHHHHHASHHLASSTPGGLATTTSTSTSNSLGRTGRGVSDPREAQRYRVARELLDTEKKYCKTLWTIQDTFADPLKKSGILSHKDITTLFPEEVYMLYDKHCLLQHQLRERLASWKWQPLVGDVLARFTNPRHTDVLRLYTAYVNDFPEVLKTFHKLCRTTPAFTKFIKSCLEQPACGGLDLGAFLLTPVQRVPRYILLLKQLLKYTETHHPDYRHIHTCLDRLRDFLARLNDSMEHSFQLVHVQLSPLSTHHHHHHHHHRSSRPARRSSSSPGSPPVSPSSADDLGSPVSHRSPQRSLSSLTQPSCRPRTIFIEARSSSLPRGCSTSSNGSRQSSHSHTDPQRIRSRSESVASRRPRGSSPSAAQSLRSGSPVGGESSPTRVLASRSAVDVSSTAHSSPEHEKATTTAGTQLWEDLAASEPSLVDPPRPAAPAPTSASGSPPAGAQDLSVCPLSSAHSVNNVNGIGGDGSSNSKLQSSNGSTSGGGSGGGGGGSGSHAPAHHHHHHHHHHHGWGEGSDDARAKKKMSIRASLKNMFSFSKKSRPSPPPPHHHHHRSYHPQPLPHNNFHHHHHNHHHNKRVTSSSANTSNSTANTYSNTSSSTANNYSNTSSSNNTPTTLSPSRSNSNSSKGRSHGREESDYWDPAHSGLHVSAASRLSLPETITSSTMGTTTSSATSTVTRHSLIHDPTVSNTNSLSVAAVSSGSNSNLLSAGGSSHDDAVIYVPHASLHESTYATTRSSCDPTYASRVSCEPTYVSRESTYAVRDSTYATRDPTYATRESTYATRESTYATRESTYSATRSGLLDPGAPVPVPPPVRPSTPPSIGDFVDEEGNPCSNV